MTSWEALEKELDRWADWDRRAAFWWRDDDAVAPGPALARLLDLAGPNGLPLALAVIPDSVEAALAEDLAARGQDIAVLQHGLAHRNLAPPDAKKCELLGVPGQVEALSQARDRLAALFGVRFLPVLVPPWNRIDKQMVPELTTCGFTALSTFTARKTAQAAPGLRQVNCHLDLLRWHPTKTFAGEAGLLSEICRQLQGRREGALDEEEPCGILTHHLVHDSACWAFLDKLLSILGGHAGARVCSAHEIFEHRPADFAFPERRLQAGGTGT
jgi:hypothetical protein